MLSPACMFHILEIMPRSGYPVAIDSDMVMGYQLPVSFRRSTSTLLALPRNHSACLIYVPIIRNGSACSWILESPLFQLGFLPVRLASGWSEPTVAIYLGPQLRFLVRLPVEQLA